MARSARFALLATGLFVACSTLPPAAEPSTLVDLASTSRATEATATELSVGSAGGGSADPAPIEIELAAAPRDLTLDGALDDWAEPTSATQNARIWLAADRRGLSLAVEIDRASTAATATPVLTLRHPAAELPPIGFENQFGLVRVDGERWCETDLDIARAGVAAEELQEREACKRWYRDQVARRLRLIGAFEATIPLGPGSSPGITVISRPDRDRTVIEAQVDVSALPALTTVDWRDLEIEIAMPGSVTHRFAAHLREPVPVVRPGSLLERVLTGPGVSPGEVAAYHLPRDPGTVHYLLNEARGYQWTPELDSPSDIAIDLSGGSRVATLGDVAIETLVVEPSFGWQDGDALVSWRGGRVLDLVSTSGGHVEAAARRGDNVEILVVREGSLSLLGTGACGGCPTLEIASVTVSRDGLFTPLTPLVVVGGHDEDLVDHKVAKDLSSIVVRYNHTDHADPARSEGNEIRLFYDGRAKRWREARKTSKPFPTG